jgi:putative membrane protein
VSTGSLSAILAQELSASGPPADPRIGLAETRTASAAYRTQLALDRTTLAWIRTTLTMGSFGFGLVGFLRSVKEKNPSPETIAIHQAARPCPLSR